MTVTGGTQCAKIKPLNEDFTETGDSYDLEYYEPHTGTVLFQGRVDDDFVSEGEDYINIDDDFHRIEGGFRYVAEITFTGTGVDGHTTVDIIRNHAAKKRTFKVWPHKDVNNWFLCRLVPDETTSGKRIDGNIGYKNLRLMFKGIRPLALIPAYDGFVTYFCDVDETEYDADEIAYWCDVDGAYNPATETISFFNSTGIFKTVINGKMIQYAQLESE